MVSDVTVPPQEGELYSLDERLNGDTAHSPLAYNWKDWEISVAFKLGGGPFEICGSYALYCRPVASQHSEP
jgi:hypothetical protein